MCSDPQTKDGNTFACRRCNDCIATRRHNWVGRAMMETALHPHGLVLTLTYNDDTQASRDAARMFCYADVRAFIKRVSSALRRIDRSHYVRFMVAGEQGDRKGRCHWHVILWSSYDLRLLGTVNALGREVSDPEAMLTVGKRVKRLHWSLWASEGHPIGFVTFQHLNHASASYVLSYCLKDQFTEEKSRGTMREAKSENFATGLFRMSKRPAIGEAWLMQKLERLAEAGAVQPSLNLSVPGFPIQYQPSGSFRKKLLWGLTALNQLVRFRTGSDAPQWGGLMQQCQDNETDMEILDGQRRPQEEEIPEWACDTTINLDAYRARGWTYNTKGRRLPVCASQVPCDSCLHNLSRRVLASIGIARVETPDGPDHYTGLDNRWPSIEDARKTRHPDGLNPYCQGDHTRW